MRKLIFITIVCAFVAAPAFADPYAQFTGIGYYGIYNGYYVGEYLVKTWDLPDVHANGVQFYTFCIEFHENVNWGTYYDAEISTEAIAGNGNSGPTGPTGGDSLDPRSAWLYDQYLNGALGLGSNALAKDVGMAIWAIEEEIPYTDLSQAQKDLITQATGQWTDTGPYRVLNLYAYGSAPNHEGYPANYRQDYIVKVPVPAAVLLGMLGFCVAGLKLRKLA